LRGKAASAATTYVALVYDKGNSKLTGRRFLPALALPHQHRLLRGGCDVSAAGGKRYRQERGLALRQSLLELPVRSQPDSDGLVLTGRSHPSAVRRKLGPVDRALVAAECLEKLPVRRGPDSDLAIFAGGHHAMAIG